MLTVTDYSPACKETARKGKDDKDIAQDCSAPAVLALIAKKVGEKCFDLWFGQDTQCHCEGEKITFHIHNDFAINVIRRHYLQEIDQAVLTVFGKKLFVDFVVKPTPTAEPKKPAVVPSIPTPIQTKKTSPLGSLFGKQEQQEKEKTVRRFATLDTFLKGISNNLAYCAAVDWAVDHPGQINPVYIFGPTSVGKTHILEGIWSAVRKNSSRRLPLYMTADQFLSSFVETIRSGSARDRDQSFRSRFKGISHLLIDDIQLFARATATQTEFLQVFDTLRNQNVQLVFTGDRPPKDLPLQNELRCRLESGMVCEIELPERELALRICESMVKQRELPVEPEVCRLVASRFGVHARKISGALSILHAVHMRNVHLKNDKPITVAVAEEALSDLLRLSRRDVRLQDIGKIVCETFGISEETLRSKSRVKQVSMPRMLAMWLARKYTRSALSEIGQYFGNRLHSTVSKAQQKIDERICKDATIAEVVQKIEQTLNSGA
jgi:chromosomal replication initiator protein